MRLLLPILLLFALRIQAAEVTHEIRYNSRGARQVYLVWGINNWQILPSGLLPPGSFVRDKVIYTEMSRNADGQFVAAVHVPEGAVIDHVFWITRGPLGKGTDIWDVNAPRKDFHSLATSNGVTLIESTVTVRPSESLSLLDIAGSILLVIAVTALIVFLFRKRTEKTPHVSSMTLMAGCSLSLLLFLAVIRPSVLGISWDIVADPFSGAPLLLYGAYHDLVYVLALSIPLMLIALLLPKNNRARKIIAGIHILFCGFSLMAGLLNVKVVELLGKPFNYRWLYYSDFLNGPDAEAAMSANLSNKEIWSMAAMLLSFLLMTYVCAEMVKIIISRRTALKRTISLATCGLILLYLTIVPAKLEKQGWDEDHLQHPVFAFLQSVNPWQSDPGLFTMAVEDSLLYRKPASVVPSPLPRGGFRNILMIVLESTPAEYIDCYGSRYGATPHLRRLSEQAAVFDHVYAHAPGTNLSMISMLNSCYPWLSYQSMTEKKPDFHFPSLAATLRSSGYRTGFFNSADNRYQKADEFLAHRKFERISDCREQTCEKGAFIVEDKKWKNMNGKDDGCTTREMLSWIRESPDRPFFGMMWTYQTHYPYFISRSLKTYDSNNPSLNRYLNALHYVDSLVGDIAEQLRTMGLAESTLLVVLGDHGEAFGRHNQITHGRMIYEENLHVPLMLINPAFSGQKHQGTGGLVDLAPTLMALLDKPAPAEWEGENLFSKQPDDRVYFFAPWSDFLFGYRQGNMKYIYNATKGKAELYDLAADPFESNDISGQHQSEIRIHHQRLAAWTQYVNIRTAEILSRAPANAVIAQAK